MKLAQAKEKVKLIMEQLKSVTDDIYDDGCENNDAEQNNRFVEQDTKIGDNCEELSKLSIDGIESREIAAIWVDLWTDEDRLHLPEDELRHGIKFCEAIIALPDDYGKHTEVVIRTTRYDGFTAEFWHNRESDDAPSAVYALTKKQIWSIGMDFVDMEDGDLHFSYDSPDDAYENLLFDDDGICAEIEDCLEVKLNEKQKQEVAVSLIDIFKVINMQWKKECEERGIEEIE